MRLITIWSIRGMPLLERLRRTRDWSARAVAAKLPVRIRYWVALQEIARATLKSPNIPATPLDEVLRNLSTPKDHI